MYLWLKAFHIIAVIAWMAGMLYLPRLFVYHAARKARLRAIGNLQGDGAPAAQIHHDAGDDRDLAARHRAGAAQWFAAGWFHAKFVMVIAMTIMHGLFSHWAHEFSLDRNRHTPEILSYCQ